MNQSKFLFSDDYMSEEGKSEEEESKQLEPLSFETTVRDGVQGDIRLLEEETHIINLPEFQRLRRTRQLGAVCVSFPTALHTRFDHSLGTVQETQRIIDAINGNPARKGKDRRWRLKPSGVRLARLCALLHDVSHIPFGHSIEDELRIMGQHDSEKVIGDALAPFRDSINTYGQHFEFSFETVLRCMPKKKTKDDNKDNNNKSAGGATEDIDPGEAPIGEIVGDTISADLWDYLKRDFYFTGIRATLDTRLMPYYYISERNGEYHLTIELDKGGAIRRDNVTEILHLLRLRYFLGERVYYHLTKTIASTMIGRAVHECYGDKREKLLKDLAELGDDELLRLLAANGNDVAERLALAVIKRDLYRPCWAWTMRGGSRIQKTLTKRIFSDPTRRTTWENECAKRLGGRDGDVLVYCPPAGMSFKQANVYVHLVQPEESQGVVRKLVEVADELDINEAITSLRKDHANLWSCYVMVAPWLLKELKEGKMFPDGVPLDRTSFQGRINPLGMNSDLNDLPIYKLDRVYELLGLDQ